MQMGVDTSRHPCPPNEPGHPFNPVSTVNATQLPVGEQSFFLHQAENLFPGPYPIVTTCLGGKFAHGVTVAYAAAAVRTRAQPAKCGRLRRCVQSKPLTPLEDSLRARF